MAARKEMRRVICKRWKWHGNGMGTVPKENTVVFKLASFAFARNVLIFLVFLKFQKRFESCFPNLCYVSHRGVPDQDFQNPAGTVFTGLFHEFWPDNPVSFCRIIRPEPDFSITKVFPCSSKIARCDKNEKMICLKWHVAIFVSSCC